MIETALHDSFEESLITVDEVQVGRDGSTNAFSPGVANHGQNVGIEEGLSPIVEFYVIEVSADPVDDGPEPVESHAPFRLFDVLHPRRTQRTGKVAYVARIDCDLERVTEDFLVSQGFELNVYDEGVDELQRRGAFMPYPPGDKSGLVFQHSRQPF